MNRVGRSPALTLGSAVAALRRHYGESARPISRDPFQLILWEQVGYLVPDAQRRRAFLTLRREVGLRPADLLAASRGQLETIARLGGSIAVRARAARLRESAELVVSKWDGDLSAALRLSVREARRALGEFAMIGEPGAERILVITKRARLLPLDSNALRVLQRLGLAPEMRDYRSTYRRAQELLAPSLPRSHQGLISASGLLRLHGQELCRRGAPACDRCPLRAACPSSTLRRPTRAIGLVSRAARWGSRRPGAGPGL